MLSKEEFIVLRHYLDEGVSKTAIARKLGISRMTVYRHTNSDKTEPGWSSMDGQDATYTKQYQGTKKKYISGRKQVSWVYI
jgi:DNA invertase Pin-like site-specific DNA recombinase